MYVHDKVSTVQVFASSGNYFGFWLISWNCGKITRVGLGV